MKKETLIECISDATKGINWKERFFQLARAVESLSENSRYCECRDAETGETFSSNVPMGDDWDRLENFAQYYKAEEKVDKLKWN